MTEDHTAHTPHRVQMAEIATRVEIETAFGQVDKESLRDDLETQFGTRDIDEATRRLSLLNQWVEENDAE